jgi:hypothetical protein
VAGPLFCSGVPRLVARLSRRVGGVPRALGSPFLVAWTAVALSAGCHCLEPADGGGDLGCPWPPGGEAESEPATAADDPAGRGEQSQPQAFWFPAAGRAGQGEQLGPGEPRQRRGRHTGLTSSAALETDRARGKSARVLLTGKLPQRLRQVASADSALLPWR